MEELLIFKDAAKKAIEQEIVPHHHHWEQSGVLPKEVWKTLGHAGLLCVDLPEEYGGSGVSFRYSQVVLQELCRQGFMGLSGSVAIQSDIVAQYILHMGNEEQKKTWLPKMASGEVVAAVAMTEPATGSDLQGMKTTAIKDGNHYIINGSKTFITNGGHADLVIVCAKTDPKEGGKGISLFLVDATLPGFSRGKQLEKIGQHAGDTTELFFDNMKVPASSLLGMENQGFLYLMQELPRERLAVAASAVSAARACLEWTIQYVKERQAFGRPIAKFQNTRFKLAEMKTQIEIHDAFVNQCVDKFEQRKMSLSDAAMVKLSATEMLCKVTDECLQLFGGYGYMSEYHIARAFVDARVLKIYAGTSEIMKEMISRELLGN
ncbi:acyl-CoA dehydrogenase [Oleiphilus messinensis]|uniref:Acyl-CoA dehydrogenase n=1 Tax=Oleiphilus messinensis TaxID=141451 RepID=A0A1Y0IAL4_9GAMM|nr:acyl-CoA dehydrogenase family protein [Oleiphilus messinensis]ARU56515.1 acyl-CoA dehydrogenase [Oleiphilus messinensis]